MSEFPVSKWSAIELSGSLIGSYAILIINGFTSAIVFSLVIAWLKYLDQPVVSSVMQGSARHNTFIALAMAERLFGNPKLAIAALIAAILIPITNVIVVSLIVIIVQGRQLRHIFR